VSETDTGGELTIDHFQLKAFAIKRLRLNRPPLVAYRLRRKKTTETLQLLQRYRDLAQSLAQSHQQTALLLEEQQKFWPRKESFCACC